MSQDFTLSKPRHVAIIMDGNGRWATARRLPRVQGHQEGAATVRMVIRACVEHGISHLTLFAFSKENWKRPQLEIQFLMDLLSRFLDSELENLKKEGVHFETIGHIEDLSTTIQRKIENMKIQTRENKKLFLTVALNYGARQEIVDAVKRCVRHYSQKKEIPKLLEQLNEKEFANFLDTAGIPDPDLLIRTSGEIRLSNFLLWQLSYTEFHVTPKFWPEFTRTDFDQAIQEFGLRQRRFGAVG